MTHRPSTTRHRVGAWLWVLRLAYVPLELSVAAAAGARLSLRDDTVSDLGALGCDPACSPWHPLMNTTFVVAGLAMALGAVLLHDRWAPGFRARAITALLVISGAGSVAVGLAPVDTYPVAHLLAAAPLFVAQPVALALLGLEIGGRQPLVGQPLVGQPLVGQPLVGQPLVGQPLVGRALVGAGLLTGGAGLAFVLVDTWAGVTERLALWPVVLALAAVGVVELRAELTDRRG